MRNSYSLVIIGFALVSIGFSIDDAFGTGFIKFDGVDGESVDKDHKGWSDLLSMSEVYETTSGSLSVRGGTISDEFLIVKLLDKSSPKLSEAIAKGQVFPKVSIDLCTNQKSYCTLSYELKNVMITSYSISGSSDELPVEEILLDYEELIRNSISETEEERHEPALEDDLMEPKPRVPLWVQSTAKFWIDKDVSDREFTDALGFLVKEKIIDVEVEPVLTETEEPSDEEPQVPAWISQTTDWWINGEVPEDQFLEGIKWMIENRIIRGLEGN
jgi:type VI secretion system Hcp family effector